MFKKMNVSDIIIIVDI